MAFSGLVCFTLVQALAIVINRMKRKAGSFINIEGWLQFNNKIQCHPENIFVSSSGCSFSSIRFQRPAYFKAAHRDSHHKKKVNAAYHLFTEYEIISFHIL
jgi:hypothetical protein